ncbi:hypothetical protein DSL92_02425 [Billgrantia gudaonensis]|uniref:Uncharacterized protein n=1 Tax=Billgrantia gudaonensis TaxID=376427 RepID=A0A3S0QS27_9GAMM|nr:hypothetical protein DSL92_02425 [Halomonas gudaonensis]
MIMGTYCSSAACNSARLYARRILGRLSQRQARHRGPDHRGPDRGQLPGPPPRSTSARFDGQVGPWVLRILAIIVGAFI